MSVSRRRFLLGASGALALSLGSSPRSAHAAPAGTPRRCVVLYFPHGSHARQWGATSMTSLGSALSSLVPHKNDITIFNNLGNQAGDDVNALNDSRGKPASPHFVAVQSLLTGSQCIIDPGAGYPKGAGSISFDEYIGNKLGTAPIHVAVPSNGSVENLSATGLLQNVPPILDPGAAFDKIFAGPASGGDAAALAAMKLRRKSVLDYAAAELAGASQRLGVAERQVYDQHAQALRDLEVQIANLQPVVCTKPGRPSAPADVPAWSKAHIDLLVTALACNVTQVATLQYLRTLSDISFSWVGLSASLHDQLSHGVVGGYDVACGWYASQLAYMIQKMKATPDGNGTTLFDNTMIVMMSEFRGLGRNTFRGMSDGESHHCDDLPFILAGRCQGQLAQGRIFDAGSRNVNDLYTSLINAMGIPSTGFGDAKYSKGPLSLA